MRTSSTLRYNTRGKNSAFTLIELVIVIFIISLTTALIVPNLWDNGKTSLRSEAKRIAITLRYIYDEAVGKKLTYTLRININESSWGFESDKESRMFKMKDDIVFRDIMIPSLGRITIGEAILPFGPLGPEEPVILHLLKNDLEYTIIFNHLNGRAKVYEGYKT